ncbi:retrovirus-related Pol polyprotein from transposon TNT 1-94 [Trichonephila clavipes]|nr:retrovirus-related Pol polyprotein from transposon TNT 1-94 [Trichonephila clavipes]
MLVCQNKLEKKFDMRAKMGIMMGYAQRTKGYRIWLIDENKLVETINVRFDENKRELILDKKLIVTLDIYIYNLNLPDYDDEDDSDRVKDSLTSRLVSKTSTETPSTSEKLDVSSDNHNLIPCTEVKWIRNIDLSEQQEALMVEVTIPNCYKQAIRSRDASKWHDAMDKEINVMMERKVWDLVDHPDNIKILENRWVYTIKYDENNKIVRYKARLVARDSDFATNRDDRVSMGGFITFIDETPISWRTFKQKSVSLSTMEAEYVSLTEAAKEFISLKNVIDNKSLNLELSENVMFCDNQAAISFSKSPVENYRTKHIDVRYHFLRNLIYDKSERSHGAAGSPLIGRDVSDQVGVREKPPKVCQFGVHPPFIPRQFSPVFWSGLFTEIQSIYLIGLESAEGYPLTVNDIPQAREIPNDTPYTVM